MMMTKKEFVESFIRYARNKRLARAKHPITEGMLALPPKRRAPKNPTILQATIDEEPSEKELAELENE